MATKASVLGHPVHPMLMVFPSALLPTSLLFHVIWFFTGEFLWLNLAFWTLVLGVVGTVAAAAAGLVDYFGMGMNEGHDAVHRTATRHLWNGVASLTIYVVVLALQWFAGAWSWGTTVPDFNRTFVLGAVVLNVIGNGFLAYQGWLGGKLVYEQGIGVEPAQRKREGSAHGVTEPGGGRD